MGFPCLDLFGGLSKELRVQLPYFGRAIVSNLACLFASGCLELSNFDLPIIQEQPRVVLRKEKKLDRSRNAVNIKLAGEDIFVPYYKRLLQP